MPSKERPSKDELATLYVDQGLSAYAIAKSIFIEHDV